MTNASSINSLVIPIQPIQPYSRVFALELQQTDIIVRDKGNRQAEIITPFDARISRIFTCGALTEITQNAKGGGFIRVADPTGVLVIYLKSRMPEILPILGSLTTPAFVSVTATIEINTSANDSRFIIVLETIKPSDRQSRDRWIVRTAHRTIERLQGLALLQTGGQGSEEGRKTAATYRDGIRQLKAFAGMVEKALSQVQDKDENNGISGQDLEISVQEDISADLVLKLIRQHSGPRGVSVQELTGYAKEAGVAELLLMDTIRALIADDEIYQPSSGFVKIL
jgi:RPA family protein